MTSSSPTDDPLADRLRRLRDDLARLRDGIGDDAARRPVPATVAARAPEAEDRAAPDAGRPPTDGAPLPQAPPAESEAPASEEPVAHVPARDEPPRDQPPWDEPARQEPGGDDGGWYAPEVGELAPSSDARAGVARDEPDPAARLRPARDTPAGRAGTTPAAERRAPPAPPPIDLPTPRAGRRSRPPRPPRRARTHPRAGRPPERFQVPQPVPVPPPAVRLQVRWPTWTPVAVVVVGIAAVPLVAQLAWRLWYATTATTPLIANPAPGDFLRAGDGVAGGALVLAIGFVALAVVRGRSGYLGAATAVLLAFGAFPWVAYTARGGVVQRPAPTLGGMLAPDGWPRSAQLRAAFVLALLLLAAALVDLVWLQLTRSRDGSRPRR